MPDAPETPDARDETETAVVNGRPLAVVGRTVRDVVVALDLPADGRGVAVAIDGDVVARDSWAARTVRAGQRIEVLTAMQGG